MSSRFDKSPIVDSHVHLDEPVFDADRDAVVAAARSAGVRRFINIGYSPARWESSRRLADQYPDVRFALGHHPQLASDFDNRVARTLRRAVEELRPIAIGETGFDYARADPSAVDQRRSFQAQLELAAVAGLPVIIHQRYAADDLIAELDQWPQLAPIVLHSFDGTARLTRWAIERGCYIGIGGLATKSGSVELRLLLQAIPIGQLLLETDSPYLSPPRSAGRRNSPANLPLIAEALAPLWAVDATELYRVTTANAVAVFGLTMPVEHVAAEGVFR